MAPFGIDERDDVVEDDGREVAERDDASRAQGRGSGLLVYIELVEIRWGGNCDELGVEGG